jgi:hypothetical protein
METTKKKETLVVGFSSRPNPSTIFEYVDSNIAGELPTKQTTAQPWYPWGVNNLFPQEIFDLVYKNDIKPVLIKQSVDLILGRGLITYKEPIDEEGKKTLRLVADPEIEHFKRTNRISTYLRERAHNLELNANAFTEMIRDGSNKIAFIKNRPSTDCRAEYIKPESGLIENYYICGNWKMPKWTEGKPENSNVIKLPAFNLESEEIHDHSMHHSKYYLPGQDYYSFPIWWHGTKPWAELTTQISIYQLANLKNGVNIRFHVRIPKAYFEQFPEDQREAKKQALQDQLDEFLSGAENASKAFYSFIQNVGGSQIEGWEIIPITYDSKDETFLKTFEVSSRANSRGHDIHPVLAGIDIQGSLGSGSEILNLYNYHTSVKTNGQREALLEIFYDIAEVNGWDPEIKFGIEYVQLTTVDKNPTGKQPVV